MLGTGLSALSSNAYADSIQSILTTLPINQVVEDRKMCDSGISGQTTALLDQAFASNQTAFLANKCIATLVRLGQAGQLGFFGDANGRAPNAPLSFDTGFVAAYRTAEQVPNNLPAVADLEPVAARCFEQTEQDKQLCYSVGYAYGLRAAKGEPVVTF